VKLDARVEELNELFIEIIAAQRDIFLHVFSVRVFLFSLIY
jgi:hypothetical protein